MTWNCIVKQQRWNAKVGSLASDTIVFTSMIYFYSGNILVVVSLLDAECVRVCVCVCVCVLVLPVADS